MHITHVHPRSLEKLYHAKVNPNINKLNKLMNKPQKKKKCINQTKGEGFQNTLCMGVRIFSFVVHDNIFELQYNLK